MTSSKKLFLQKVLFISFFLSGCGLTANLDDVNPSDNDTSSDTIKNNSDSNSDSDSNTDTNVETPTDIDSNSDSNTTTPKDSESDTGHDCAQMGWTCGSGDNNKGVEINCTTPGCADVKEYCHLDLNICTPCSVDLKCGSLCTKCKNETPFCNYDTDRGIDIEHAQCVECTKSADCPSEKPNCDTNNNTCHECLTSEHCQNGASSPLNSPLGICTPDNTCTCYVSTDTDECSADIDCPQDLGFKCVLDYFDGLNTHKACLRDCGSTEIPAENGLECVDKVSANVWSPMTSCFAFNKLGKDCSNHEDCSVDKTGPINDGFCSDKCTYACTNDDTQCFNTTCGDTPPLSDLCIP